MTDHRDHLLVLAEISAAGRGHRDELDTGVANELGVTADAYRAYRHVCAAIDRYGDRHRHDPAPSGAGQTPLAGEEVAGLRGTADVIVEAALDLYSRPPSRIARRPNEVVSAARRLLTTALSLKAQLAEVSCAADVRRDRMPRAGERR